MKLCIDLKEIARCLSCNGLVKPDIVFFGESLPPKFIQSIPAMWQADLLIVIGTSLTVHPFASLASRVNESCPRVLINIERVGDFGRKKHDVILLGKCDEIVMELCAKLGWAEELEKTWAETAGAVEATEEGATVRGKREGKEGKEKNEDKEEKDLKKEVDFLTAAIRARLDLQEEMKGEKEEKKIDVTESERAPTDHDRGPIPSDFSRPNAEFSDESETDEETSTSASKPTSAEENEGVDNVGGKL